MGTDRYQAGGTQATWQPGSDERVLLNKLGITDSAEMDEVELHLLLQLYELVLGDQLPVRQLNVADLKEWHRLWLGNVYEWAGQGLLDYSVWDADKPAYFAAIQRGMARDYAPMRDLVSRALDAARA